MSNKEKINEYGELERYNTKGELHCETGPAVELPNGKVEYYLHGLEYNKAAWESVIENRERYNNM